MFLLSSKGRARHEHKGTSEEALEGAGTRSVSRLRAELQCNSSNKRLVVLGVGSLCKGRL